jgi:hypothetical protein
VRDGGRGADAEQDQTEQAARSDAGAAPVEAAGDRRRLDELDHRDLGRAEGAAPLAVVAGVRSAQVGDRATVDGLLADTASGVRTSPGVYRAVAPRPAPIASCMEPSVACAVAAGIPRAAIVTPRPMVRVKRERDPCLEPFWS